MIPRRLLPEFTYWFIAGGFAACPALATDIDVWISVCEGEEAVERRRLLAHLKAERFTFTEQTDSRHMDVTRVNRAVPYQHTLNVLKVADVKVPANDKLFHIMVVNGTIEDVLHGFDISTHQVAIGWDGRVTTGPGWTPPHVYPVRLQNSNDKTEIRMQKIAERFGHVYRAPLVEVSQ